MPRLPGPALASFLACSCTFAAAQAPAAPQPTLGHRSAAILHVDGLDFKDLNHNGRLDPYEDWRLTPAERTADLLRQMTIAELAGTMLHGTLPVASGPLASIGMGSGGYDLAKVHELVDNGAQQQGFDSHNYYGR